MRNKKMTGTAAFLDSVSNVRESLHRLCTMVDNKKGRKRGPHHFPDINSRGYEIMDYDRYAPFCTHEIGWAGRAAMYR